MAGKLFVAGVVIGALAVVFFTSRREGGPPEEASPSILEAIGILTPKQETPAAEVPPPRFLESPQYLPLRQAMDLRTRYGKVHLAPGTSIWALRETEDGIRVKIAGAEMLMPVSAFREVVPTVAVRPPSQVDAMPPVANGAGILPPATNQSIPAPSAASPVTASTSPSAAATGRFDTQNSVVIEGASGTGSASIVNMQGKAVIITNAHVVSGNSALRFRRLDGTEVKPEKIGISTQCDLAMASQSQLRGGLPMAEDVSKEVAVGDDVIVLGNSQGSGVVTEIPGKVLGIGPELVEVDAKFVEGNSGSPIVQTKTGKVIAIATFVTLRNSSMIDKDSPFNGIRRFGYRLDVAKAWEYPEPARFAAEAATLQQRRHVTEMLATVFVDIDDDGYLSLGAHQSANNPARPCMLDYLRAVDQARHPSTADIMGAKSRLFRELLYLANSGEVDTSGFTRWHANELDKDRRVRKFLRERFAEFASYQDAATQLRRR